ncbi:MAG: hypothetical protein Q7J44_20360 [Pseudotabrizicola sp.]|uniref:hypothetical protein n=1 Tax=Pseudotabrizicola sp. TaxID=2939647 RepID=UPI00271701B6|nr:hypothetical protein [Pseudotabrizicola sp.]MDO9640892.1 hypothetical protein [Pseudotabrizicola sp.]
MPRKLEDFTPAECAVIDHLYGFAGPVGYSDYLERRYDQELDRSFLEMMETGKPVAPSAEIFQAMIRRVLDRHHPHPDSILNPGLPHRAFAGFKKLTVEACEVFVLRDAFLEHLLDEIDTRGMSDEQTADLVVKILVHEMVFDQGKTASSNPYAAPARWQQDPDGPEEELPKAMIWGVVQECLWGSVVGITETMSDVLARGRYAVAWQICRIRQGEVLKQPK